MILTVTEIGNEERLAPRALPTLGRDVRDVIPTLRKLTAVEILLISVGVMIGICALTAVVLSGMGRSRWVSYERNASASLTQVVTAQEWFRANDLDRNGVNDYWTADVAGLYCLQDIDTGNPIGALNNIGVATADLAAGKFSYSNDRVRYAPEMLLSPLPNRGYVFQVLKSDELGQSYAMDTDGTGSAGHNKSKFGAAAIPVAWDSTGTYVFVVTETGAVMRRDFGPATATPSFGTPLRSFDGVTPCDAPSLSASWQPVE